VPVRCSPTRLTPNASMAWSLAAVPNPRSPTTVAGGRPVHTTPAAFRASLGRLGGRALGALNILGTALDVYSYFQYEKPLADQGWTACTDQATGLPKIPVSLCPPTAAGGPPVG
jgi:hypothetical protein